MLRIEPLRSDSRKLYCSPFSLSGWLRLPLALLDRLRGRRVFRERTLIVVRHATAERQRAGESDRERSLTEAGRVDAERLGGVLAERRVRPDCILTSPARRAAETTSRLAAAGDVRVATRVEERLYQASVTDVLRVLAEVSDSARSVLVVAHDPAVSELVAALTGAREPLPAGGMAMVRSVARSWSELGRNGASATLVGLWRPADTSPQSAEQSVVEPSPAGAKAAGGRKWIVARADERVAEVAARTLENRFEWLCAAAAGEPQDAAPEADVLRRFRVAGRRTEAALKAYRELLPRKRCERLRKDLRELRRATRCARDEQVLAERLEPRASEPCVAVVLAVLRSHDDAPHRLAAALAASDKEESFAARAADLVGVLRRRAEGDAASERFGEWAARRYAGSIARYRAELARTPPEERSVAALHELRLAGKRLRYEIELLAAGLQTEVRARVYPELVRLQDLLGAVSDEAAALGRLEAIVAELDASHPRDDLAAIVAAQRMRVDEARATAVAGLARGNWALSVAAQRPIL